ncbi:hypothetical protein PG993_014086 [Apiospora rasikravindrae]|uniref:Uncharacterized protein n=1 Tax=Apiospora rasikravindrae TaxID=990691 RepID=A0ABR1RS22_9PEZI
MAPSIDVRLNDEDPTPPKPELAEDRPFDGPLKLDKHGLPLVPQPSDSQDDPLNWPALVKHGILLQVSLLTLLGTIGAATINPAFVPLAAAFDITPVQASYELTVWIVFAAVCPVFLVPLANVHGRLPFYVLGNLLAAATNLAAGHCNQWSALLATRALNGIGAGCAAALGPATSYIQFGLVAITFFCLPETLYLRKTDESGQAEYKMPVGTFADLLFFRARRRGGSGRKLTLSSYAAPFAMMRYLSIILPALYYMTAFAYGSLLFGATGSVVFRTFYGFDTAQTGLIISIPLVLGCLFGRMQRRLVHGLAGLPRSAASRRWGAPARVAPRRALARAAGPRWHRRPGLGMAIASFGLQVAGTVTYTYCTDCYKPQAAEISVVLTLFRHIYCGIVPFYAVPLADRIQYQYAWLLFACLNVAFLLPLVILRLCGEQFRNSKWQPKPAFHPNI